jgi:hypothetical protein
MAQAVAGATVSALPDGHVLLAGGDTTGGATNTLELFDPQSASFGPLQAKLTSPGMRRQCWRMAGY